MLNKNNTLINNNNIEDNHESKTNVKKQNWFLKWYQSLTKKKKIYFFLWIFLPLFIVILVASLLGTTMNQYHQVFNKKNNTIYYENQNFNNLFESKEVNNSIQYQLNYSNVASSLVQYVNKKNFPSGKNVQDWLPYLYHNNFVIYLELSNLYENDIYIQLINKNNKPDLKFNQYGQYDNNYSNLSKNKAFNGNTNGNENQIFNYAYISLSKNLFMQYEPSQGWSYTLVLSQLQQLRNQYPDLDINLNNVI